MGVKTCPIRWLLLEALESEREEFPKLKCGLVALLVLTVKGLRWEAREGNGPQLRQRADSIEGLCY